MLECWSGGVVEWWGLFIRARSKHDTAPNGRGKRPRVWPIALVITVVKDVLFVACPNQVPGRVRGPQFHGMQNREPGLLLTTWYYRRPSAPSN